MFQFKVVSRGPWINRPSSTVPRIYHQPIRPPFLNPWLGAPDMRLRDIPVLHLRYKKKIRNYNIQMKFHFLRIFRIGHIWANLTNVFVFWQSRGAGNPLYPYTYPQKVLMSTPIQIAQPSQYPVHPDVRLRRLPFFDMLGELLKPSSLVPQGSMRIQENTFVFHLTPSQATDIAASRDCRAGSKMDYTVQVSFTCK